MNKASEAEKILFEGLRKYPVITHRRIRTEPPIEESDDDK